MVPDDCCSCNQDGKRGSQAKRLRLRKDRKKQQRRRPVRQDDHRPGSVLPRQHVLHPPGSTSSATDPAGGSRSALGAGGAPCADNHAAACCTEPTPPAALGGRRSRDPRPAPAPAPCPASTPMLACRRPACPAAWPRPARAGAPAPAFHGDQYGASWLQQLLGDRRLFIQICSAAQQRDRHGAWERPRPSFHPLAEQHPCEIRLTLGSTALRWTATARSASCLALLVPSRFRISARLASCATSRGWLAPGDADRDLDPAVCSAPSASFSIARPSSTCQRVGQQERHVG